MAQLDVPRGSSPPAESRASTLADEELRTENNKTDASVIDDKTVVDTASRSSRDKDPEKQEEAPAPSADELSEDEYPSGAALISVVAALILSIFLIALDMVRSHDPGEPQGDSFTDSCLQTIVATAIPKITQEFKGLDKVGWYGAIFFATIGGFQSTCKLSSFLHHPPPGPQ
jgi:hypothetical protein